jgi:hypothetical protein
VPVLIQVSGDGQRSVHERRLAAGSDATCAGEAGLHWQPPSGPAYSVRRWCPLRSHQTRRG